MPDQTNTPSSIAEDNESQGSEEIDHGEASSPSARRSAPEGLNSDKRTSVLSPVLLEEMEKWRRRDLDFKLDRAHRRRAPDREAGRKAYAERIKEEEGREVRAYLPSTLERRKLQKAASRARRKAAMTHEQIEERRRQDRERKAFQRELQREYDNTELLAQLDEFLADHPED